MSSISTKQLAVYAVDQIESGTTSPAVAEKLAAYLLQERRSRDMPQVMRAVEEELTRRGSSQVIVTSAHEVSENVKRQLAELLEVKNPVFSEVIDPSVIGGVKAVSGEKQIDLTVQAKLQKFKATVSRSN